MAVTTKAQADQVASPNGASPGELESHNPATGQRIGSVPTVRPDQVQSIVDDVAEVQPAWAQLSLAERSEYLRRTAQLLVDHSDEITALITREQGKPRLESYTMELLPTVDLLHWCADNGPEILAREPVRYPQLLMKQKKSAFSYEPLGVVGVIAPWNYPWSIPFGEVAIALMAGNGVVLKPASLTPLIGQRIQESFERAGLPQGLVQTVHGGGTVGQALVESSAAKIFFTGSVEVGRRVGEECARRMKGSVLELGGKDPQIVCTDANLANAISGAVWGGFANAGQTCSGIERVYVMDEIADRFIDGVVRKAGTLTVGDPAEWTTEIGPMVSREQYELVCELVDDAIASGAKRLCGGPVEMPGFEGHFIAPTVLTDVTHDMRIMREEIFGPVVPIIRVETEDEAIELANDSQFGLGASVWTLDREKGERIADRIQAGMVWINDHSYSHGTCQCAWGGVKESGLGRSHSKFGFYECVNIKMVSWEPSRMADAWWQPYDETLAKAIRASLRLIYGRNDQRKEALRQGLVPLMRVTGRSIRAARRT
jgi:acyl-CoA reductase-like NAD-dependent aldehyde dehydrogenase